MVQLQDRLEDIRARGLGLAAISYDSTDVLRRFSERFAIRFPLLADDGSAVIRRFGLLNREMQEGTEGFGVPYPGTFIVDREGIVRQRFFEVAYQERDATSTMLLSVGAEPAGRRSRLETAHLEVTLSVSDPNVSPGHRFALVFDVVPKPGMHVYARGDHDYRPIAPLIDPGPALSIHSIDWPPPREYFFEPLQERVPVYDRAFRLVQPLTLNVAAGNELVRTSSALTIRGSLSYQACDDKICYLPQTVPFALLVDVKPLVRDRAR